MSRTSIEINGKTYQLRIASRYVAVVQEKLGGKTFSDAIFDLLDNPVKNTVPFIWGMLNSQKPAVVEEYAEYSLYDELVSQGYEPDSFAKLVLDICETSGFFTEAQKKGLRKLPQVMDEMNATLTDKMLTQLEKIEELNFAQKQQLSESSISPVLPMDLVPKNSGKARTAKARTSSRPQLSAKKQG